MLDHRPIGKIVDARFMPSEALGMECTVKVINLAAAEKALGLGLAAHEAGPVAGGEGRHFIEEEQRGVALPHGS